MILKNIMKAIKNYLSINIFINISSNYGIINNKNHH